LLSFKTIDINDDRGKVIEFRKDSFLISFGEISGFGDEKEYLSWLEKKISNYPDGFVMVKKGDIIVGQLELTIREYEDREIGYVNLYYLIPENRGRGMGKQLHQYALNFFKNHNVNEYHLRVSPTNINALKFYKKLGLEEVGPEVNGKVIRMKGTL